ncbi:hypothetical protein C8R45DRAFT_1080631 [Mycena sanguinolenta]|nr:hypothetical protein C8R45DRAFT_1080631 [Mycena sanguinolenta]
MLEQAGSEYKSGDRFGVRTRSDAFRKSPTLLNAEPERGVRFSHVLDLEPERGVRFSSVQQQFRGTIHDPPAVWHKGRPRTQQLTGATEGRIARGGGQTAKSRRDKENIEQQEEQPPQKKAQHSEEDQDGLHADEDTQALSDNSGNKYQDAAEALKDTQHWQGVERHVMMSSEMSCRTAIDMVLIAAIDLAQKNLVENPEIDAEVSKRHNLKGPKCCDPSGRKYASWIVLHQEVEVPDQPLTDTIAAHGVLDYLIGAVPTASVTARLNAGGQFLTRDIYGRGDTAKKIRQSMTSIQEAKAESTFADEKSCAQAQAQGAAMCIDSQRGSVVNTLTDGVRWRFFQVNKNTKAKKKNGSAPRRKPFKAASTRVFNIFHGRDLEIILRLLTISILSDWADFGELAAGSRQKKALTMPININV